MQLLDTEEAPVQEESEEKDLCRDFVKGDCRRKERCIYNHPKLDVCRDYQFRQCTRQGCRFVHVTKEEEETFAGSGILPEHVDNGPFKNSGAPKGGQGGYNGGMLGKRSYNAMSSAPPMPMPYGQQNPSESSSDICRDFEKGDCRRGTRCKFYHPKLIICRDFQKDKCARNDCRFLHMTTEEEKTYEGNGIVPDSIDKEKMRKNRVMTPSNGGGGGGGGMGGDMYGKRMPDPGYQHQPMGYSNVSLEAVMQENASLKMKLTEMQQQIMDLRKMNDTLYEQNNNYRNTACGL